MTTVKVVRTSSNPDNFSANIDDEIELEFDDDGEATADVEPGTHTLGWAMIGAGETFTVKVTRPKKTGCGGKNPKNGTKLSVTVGVCEFVTTV
jgi:hypothetical protein